MAIEVKTGERVDAAGTRIPNVTISIHGRLFIHEVRTHADAMRVAVQVARALGPSLGVAG